MGVQFQEQDVSSEGTGLASSVLDRISGTYEVHLLVHVLNIADPKYIRGETPWCR
jgi:hypothetical protein